MTANINFTSTGTDTGVSSTQATQASRISTPAKQITQLPQDNATIRSLSDLVRGALKQPEVRAERVSAIRKSLAAGTYRAEPSATASAMIAEHLHGD